MGKQFGIPGATMAELLVQFQARVVARNGAAYRARACGGEAMDGTSRWHGWIEFVPLHGGPSIRTPRETTQRNRSDTAYWAGGLTPFYLEGALQRALDSNLVLAGSFRQPMSASASPALINFSGVGGMSALKAQVRRIIETIHRQPDQARRYGIVRNGILLHGPPGCGKSFFAKAMAGEFGFHFLRIPLESAVTKYVGGAPEAIKDVFREAEANLPCLLFFDEFDAVACKRRDAVTIHEQQMVNALLQQLDTHREMPGLLIVAATNRFEDLDPAVIREGRFDYKIKIPKPDLEARQEILRVLIRGRPHDPGLDMAGLARDLDGCSAAQIRSIVDEAALMALEARAPVDEDHLRMAYRAHSSASRYGGMKLGWDDLILPAETKRKLQLIQKFIENPQLVRDLGVAPPTGILLFGPPGNGKTTIGRVLASETEATFLSVNAADILSKWLGDSERHVKELFAQARNHVPAIIFIDELDALLEQRGEALSGGDHARNAVVNTFLAEMDGIDPSARIFVVGATNRPELLDSALMRPGRLGEAIEISLPDASGRKELLKQFSKKMRLTRSLDLENLVAQTEGASGADLKGLCTLAGRNAFLRQVEAGGTSPVVTMDDFAKAVLELSARESWTAKERSIGFHGRRQNKAE